MQTAREGSNIRQLFHRTGPTSCDTTSKLGKSERGAVRAMVRGPCWFAWVGCYPVSRHAVPLSAPSRPRHTRDAFNLGQADHCHAVAASKTTVTLGMSCPKLHCKACNTLILVGFPPRNPHTSDWLTAPVSSPSVDPTRRGCQ